MEKSVLIIDTPPICRACPCYTNLHRCKTNGKLSDSSSKPDWCPLKPLPEKRNTIKLQDFGNSQILWTDKDIYQNEGWNACLDEITGERE